MRSTCGLLKYESSLQDGFQYQLLNTIENVCLKSLQVASLSFIVLIDRLHPITMIVFIPDV